MNLLKIFAADNHWSWLLPELLLAFMALGLLASEWTIGKKRASSWAGPKTCATFGLLALWCVFSFFQGWLSDNFRIGFNGLIEQSDFTALMRVFFLLVGMGVAYIAHIYFSKRKEAQVAGVEFYAVLMLTVAAAMLLVQAHHFVMLFVSLEAMSVGLYVLISFARITEGALEAGLKYLILAGVSSAILLMGIAFLYGAAGNPLLGGYVDDPMNFTALRVFIDLNAHNPFVLFGAALVMAGIAFKLGLVPFQIWIPDVYQGAPLPTTALLSIGSKPAGVCVMLSLIMGPFASLGFIMIPLLAVLSILTILFGNIAAAPQKNTKRLMGLSGIAHVGYIAMGLAATYTVSWAIGAIVFYLFAYMVSSFIVFGVMAHWASLFDESQQIFNYEKMSRESPLLAGVLAIGLGSLAGIPPLVGFIAKFFLFMAACEAGLYALVCVAAFGVVISIYYYFGWMRCALFRAWFDVNAEDAGMVCNEACAEEMVIGCSHRALLVFLSAVSVLLGIFPAILTAFCF
jgi:NADH-quinone oxidoreductase subunit N